MRAGLTQDPPSIPPKESYDAEGSLLFDDITRLTESAFAGVAYRQGT